MAFYGCNLVIFLLLAVAFPSIANKVVPKGCVDLGSDFKIYDFILSGTKWFATFNPGGWDSFDGSATVCFNFKVEKETVTSLVVKVPIVPENFILVVVTKDQQTLHSKGSVNGFSWKFTSGWHHSCWVLNTTYVSMYDDGHLHGIHLLNSEGKDFTFQSTLGFTKDPLDNEPKSNGTVAFNDVRYYDRELTPEEVRDVACGSPSAPQNLITGEDKVYCFGSYYRNTTVERPSDCSKA